MLFLAATTTSCDWLNFGHISHYYSILLSFRDTLGNDLISGIEFDYCNDRMTYCEIHNENVFHLHSNIAIQSSSYGVRIIKFDDYYYLDAGIWGDEDLRRIVFKLRCPHIFGDNNQHEFITYWETADKQSKQHPHNIYHECTHIEHSTIIYGEKNHEFPIEKNPYLSSNSATIILDR
jgi:hypothetical protein